MTGWDVLAPVYAPLMRPLETVLLRRWRRRAVAALPAAAPIIEVGAGPAMNAMLYERDANVVITDRSVAMAGAAAHRAGGRPVVVADVEQLPFRDGVFAASLATLVFCAVPDPQRGLGELLRVVARGGTAVFLEHVRPRNPLGAVLADVAERVSSLAGEHVNRRTAEEIAAAGFAIEKVENALGTLLRLIVARR